MSDIQVKEPSLLVHCREVYTAMAAKAEQTELGLVYEGALTKTIKLDCNLPTPYYTWCTRGLIQMDCIRQLRRGGGGQPSQWLLLREPTRELFALVSAHSVKTGAGAQAAQQVRDLNTRVSDLETEVRILKALVTAGLPKEGS